MDNQNNRNNQNRNNQNDNKNKNNKQGLSFVILTAVITTFLVLTLYQFQKNGTAEEITYDQFLKMIEQHKVEEVVISSDRISITAKKEEGERAGRYDLYGRDEYCAYLSADRADHWNVLLVI